MSQLVIQVSRKHRAAVFCSILWQTYSQGHAFCRTDREFSYVRSYTSKVNNKILTRVMFTSRRFLALKDHKHSSFLDIRLYRSMLSVYTRTYTEGVMLRVISTITAMYL